MWFFEPQESGAQPTEEVTNNLIYLQQFLWQKVSCLDFVSINDWKQKENKRA